ncbi:hypothetical protein Saro_0042 [Novosphingobium aromaticivorans DSM 12444]|uniref:Uncharacterized protein n=1 Tax=Novosphingobium aromaticivorans (strain ATCC 700278 / DSM 12444 / CCUG 56034 / CIP 105152 / NBRC 16084 / F199) TaxID=279238 RepID=Q2G2Z2_NOVAD|nr:hypothetical protein [Novosphingobium aromaticivorans]ABD24491.1 hypothetical protein Saro_0042 [Novosphingobium aromaticivorans DSM 12444]
MDMSFNDPGAFVPANAAGELRPLTWQGLCARIVAAQDLRRALAGFVEADGAAATGSFHGQAARFIASGFSGIPAHGEGSEQLVNQPSSANGKATLATQRGSNDRGAVGLR